MTHPPQSLPEIQKGPDHLQLGPASRLVSLEAVASELRVSPPVAKEFLAALRVPTLSLGGTTYVNLWSLDFTIFCILAPGGPGYAGRPGHYPPIPTDLLLCPTTFIQMEYDLAAVLFSGMARDAMLRRLKALAKSLTDLTT